MKIFREIQVKGSIDKAYNAYADIENWKKVMSDVVGVKIDYDDGIHQEFDMTVKRGNQEETVHSIRFCYPYHRIELFQTKPPPLFKKMAGMWTFTSIGSNTLIQATREYIPKEGVDLDPSILEAFLEKNLSSFKAWIENCASNQC